MTNPAYNLDISGTQQIVRPSANGTTVTNALVLFSGQNGSPGGGAAIRFDHSFGGLGQTRGAIINSLDDAGSFGQSVGLVFSTGQATLTERMRITGGGQVCIAKTVAEGATALDVSGNIKGNNIVCAWMVDGGSGSTKVSTFPMVYTGGGYVNLPTSPESFQAVEDFFYLMPRVTTNLHNAINGGGTGINVNNASFTTPIEVATPFSPTGQVRSYLLAFF